MIRVVFVGRPNVGKSTLFNRLYGRRRALVFDEPGVTRDRMEADTTWTVQGKELPVLLVDTGGVGGDRFAEEIEAQVETALEEADVVVFLFDGASGLVPMDHEVLRRIRSAGIEEKKPIIGVINKVDADLHEDRIHEFYETGLEHLLTISAEHNRGTDELQEKIVELAGGVEAFQVEEVTDGDDDDRIPRVAIIGKPNAGKSTLVNALLGQSRMVTSPIAGTTVDSIDTDIDLDGMKLTLIDTAGIRRKSKTEKGIEVLSVVQAKKSLERADLAILLLNGEDEFSDQDEKIGGLIEEAGCSVIIAVNKWDLHAKGGDRKRRETAEELRRNFGFLQWAPILFVSAKYRKGLKGLGELIEDVLQQRRYKIPTNELTQWVRRELDVHNPKAAKFYFCHQASKSPPSFVFHVNDSRKVHFSLKRHLANGIRDKWGYMGSPIRMVIRGRSQAKAKAKRA